MARSKKKSIAQNVVGVATTGMPQPVRKMLGGRIAALLIVVAIPVLFATGIVSVTWEGGRPRLQFNQQRAAQVKQEAAKEVKSMTQKYTDRDKTTLSIPFTSGDKQDSSLGQQVQELGKEISEFSEQTLSLPPAPAAPQTGSKSEFQPLSRLKGKLEDWRK